MRDVPVLWTYQPRPGRLVRAFTEFGVLGKIGVNSAGVGIHFNILRHDTDHAEIGVPVHLVARRILDEATDVAEATEIARSARTSASTVITVADFDGVRGQARSLEVCPAGVGVVPAGTDGVLLHTNHFLDPALTTGEKLGLDNPGTYDRLKHLRARVDDLLADDLTARAKAMLGHGPDGAPVCAHADPAEPFHERSETLATISLDLAGHRLHVHRGGPCRVGPGTWQTL
jgi:isopenicillin-N N-acyltransferase like protein